MASNDSHLTEMILAIHNEIQSAVDYISEAAAKSGTELGKSSAVMCIENLRVKIPFLIEIEQKMGAYKEITEIVDVDDLKKRLSGRKGFMIDKGEKGKMALYSRVKVLPSLNVKEDNEGGTYEKGEIEIVFSPVNRA